MSSFGDLSADAMAIPPDAAEGSSSHIPPPSSFARGPGSVGQRSVSSRHRSASGHLSPPSTPVVRPSSRSRILASSASAGDAFSGVHGIQQPTDYGDETSSNHSHGGRYTPSRRSSSKHLGTGTAGLADARRPSYASASSANSDRRGAGGRKQGSNHGHFESSDVPPPLPAIDRVRSPMLAGASRPASAPQTQQVIEGRFTMRQQVAQMPHSRSGNDVPSAPATPEVEHVEVMQCNPLPPLPRSPGGSRPATSSGIAGSLSRRSSRQEDLAGTAGSSSATAPSSAPSKPSLRSRLFGLRKKSVAAGAGKSSHAAAADDTSSLSSHPDEAGFRDAHSASASASASAAASPHSTPLRSSVPLQRTDSAPSSRPGSRAGTPERERARKRASSEVAQRLRAGVPPSEPMPSLEAQSEAVRFRESFAAHIPLGVSSPPLSPSAAARRTDLAPDEPVSTHTTPAQSPAVVQELRRPSLGRTGSWPSDRRVANFEPVKSTGANDVSGYPFDNVAGQRTPLSQYDSGQASPAGGFMFRDRAFLQVDPRAASPADLERQRSKSSASARSALSQLSLASSEGVLGGQAFDAAWTPTSPDTRRLREYGLGARGGASPSSWQPRLDSPFGADSSGFGSRVSLQRTESHGSTSTRAARRRPGTAEGVMSSGELIFDSHALPGHESPDLSMLRRAPGRSSRHHKRSSTSTMASIATNSTTPPTIPRSSSLRIEPLPSPGGAFPYLPPRSSSAASNNSPVGPLSPQPSFTRLPLDSPHAGVQRLEAVQASAPGSEDDSHNVRHSESSTREKAGTAGAGGVAALAARFEATDARPIPGPRGMHSKVPSDASVETALLQERRPSHPDTSAAGAAGTGALAAIRAKFGAPATPAQTSRSASGLSTPAEGEGAALLARHESPGGTAVSARVSELINSSASSSSSHLRMTGLAPSRSAGFAGMATSDSSSSMTPSVAPSVDTMVTADEHGFSPPPAAARHRDSSAPSERLSQRYSTQSDMFEDAAESMLAAPIPSTMEHSPAASVAESAIDDARRPLLPPKNPLRRRGPPSPALASGSAHAIAVPGVTASESGHAASYRPSMPAGASSEIGHLTPPHRAPDPARSISPLRRSIEAFGPEYAALGLSPVVSDGMTGHVGAVTLSSPASGQTGMPPWHDGAVQLQPAPKGLKNLKQNGDEADTSAASLAPPVPDKSLLSPGAEPSSLTDEGVLISDEAHDTPEDKSTPPRKRALGRSKKAEGGGGGFASTLARMASASSDALDKGGETDGEGDGSGGQSKKKKKGWLFSAGVKDGSSFKDFLEGGSGAADDAKGRKRGKSLRGARKSEPNIRPQIRRVFDTPQEDEAERSDTDQLQEMRPRAASGPRAVPQSDADSSLLTQTSHPSLRNRRSTESASSLSRKSEALGSPAQLEFGGSVPPLVGDLARSRTLTGGSTSAVLREDLSPEQRRLLNRRNVLRELVDTERSYASDLAVVRDVYLARARARCGMPSPSAGTPLALGTPLQSPGSAFSTPASANSSSVFLPQRPAALPSPIAGSTTPRLASNGPMVPSNLSGSSASALTATSGTSSIPSNRSSTYTVSSATSHASDSHPPPMPVTPPMLSGGARPQSSGSGITQSVGTFSGATSASAITLLGATSLPGPPAKPAMHLATSSTSLQANVPHDAPLAPNDIRTIFAHLEQCAAFADEMVAHLQAAMGQMAADTSFTATTIDVEDDEIGRIFLKLMPRIEQVYTSYCSKHEASITRLQDLSTSSPKFAAFLKECTDVARGQTNAWDLSSLLIKPVQRVLKYPLLIQQIMSSTSPEHPDLPNLRAALTEIQQVADNINEVKKRKDLVEHILTGKTTQRSGSQKVQSGTTKRLKRKGEKVKGAIVGPSNMDPMGDDYLRLTMQFSTLHRNVHRFARHCLDWSALVRNAYEGEIRLLAQFCVVYHLADNAELDGEAKALEERMQAQVALLRGIIDGSWTQLDGDIRATILPMTQRLDLMFEAPRAVMGKRDERELDYARYRSSMSKSDKVDRKLVEAANGFVALHAQLIDELPQFIYGVQTLLDVGVQAFARLQANHHLQVKRARLEFWRDNAKSDEVALHPATQELTVRHLHTVRVYWQAHQDAAEIAETLASGAGDTSVSVAGHGGAARSAHGHGADSTHGHGFGSQLGHGTSSLLGHGSSSQLGHGAVPASSNGHMSDIDESSDPGLLQLPDSRRPSRVAGIMRSISGNFVRDNTDEIRHSSNSDAPVPLPLEKDRVPSGPPLLPLTFKTSGRDSWFVLNGDIESLPFLASVDKEAYDLSPETHTVPLPSESEHSFNTNKELPTPGASTSSSTGMTRSTSGERREAETRQKMRVIATIYALVDSPARDPAGRLGWPWLSFRTSEELRVLSYDKDESGRELVFGRVPDGSLGWAERAFFKA